MRAITGPSTRLTPAATGSAHILSARVRIHHLPWVGNAYATTICGSAYHGALLQPRVRAPMSHKRWNRGGIGRQAKNNTQQQRSRTGTAQRESKRKQKKTKWPPVAGSSKVRLAKERTSEHGGSHGPAQTGGSLTCLRQRGIETKQRSQAQERQDATCGHHVPATQEMQDRARFKAQACRCEKGCAQAHRSKKSEEGHRIHPVVAGLAQDANGEHVAS